MVGVITWGSQLLMRIVAYDWLRGYGGRLVMELAHDASLSHPSTSDRTAGYDVLRGTMSLQAFWFPATLQNGIISRCSFNIKGN